MISEIEYQTAILARAPQLGPLHDAFWKSASDYKVNPFVLAAVSLRESDGGLVFCNPGGDGHGWGLMQIDDRTWMPSSIEAAKTNPAVSIRDAAWLLAKNMRAFPGNLQAAVAAYNCGTYNASKGLALGNPDLYTTGKHYGSWVIKKAVFLRGSPLDV